MLFTKGSPQGADLLKAVDEELLISVSNYWLGLDCGGELAKSRV